MEPSNLPCRVFVFSWSSSSHPSSHGYSVYCRDILQPPIFSWVKQSRSFLTATSYQSWLFSQNSYFKHSSFSGQSIHFTALVAAIHSLKQVICFSHRKSSNHPFFEGYCIYFKGDFPVTIVRQILSGVVSSKNVVMCSFKMTEEMQQSLLSMVLSTFLILTFAVIYFCQATTNSYCDQPVRRTVFFSEWQLQPSIVSKVTSFLCLSTDTSS